MIPSDEGMNMTTYIVRDRQPYRPPIQIASGDGALVAEAGTVFITKGSAADITLAAPTAGKDDGKQLTIIATTAHAHTVTNTTPGFNNASTSGDVATFGGAVGDSMTLRAYNGIWYTTTLRNVTLA